MKTNRLHNIFVSGPIDYTSYVLDTLFDISRCLHMRQAKKKNDIEYFKLSLVLHFDRIQLSR